MEKEEILQAAQQENSGKDLADLEAQKKGANIGFAVGVFVVNLLVLIEYFITDRINVGYYVIWLAMEAALFIYKFIKLKKKHELIISIIYVVGLALAITAYVFNFTFAN